MKKLLPLIATVFISINLFAQAPQKMSYQAVIRNASNALVTNAPVKMRISILQGNNPGTSVYSELHSATTNANGLVSIEIGEGTNKTGTFSSINWGNGTYFLRTETDPNNGTNYTITGTSQLLSVPYALEANNAANARRSDSAKFAGNGLPSGGAQNQIMYWNGTSWVMLSPGSNGQTLTICNGMLTWTTGGVCPPLITTLNCAGATNIGTLKPGVAASGVNSVVPYTGGNGETYAAQNISSTGVTGLTATLAAGTLVNGAGTLNYTITGTPATSGTASFALSIGGQSCTLSRSVEITVTDASGNTYPTVTIGTQVWMAENLRTTKYRDGSNIPVVTDNTQWANNWNNGNPLQQPMMCWYNNDQATYTANKFGALYNWYAINPATNGNKNVCPTGWHVPTDAEWTTLTTFLGGQNVAGGNMKSTGTQYWSSPNTDATNSSGFSGLPGGFRVSNGVFDNFGLNGNWWSSTETSTVSAWNRRLGYSLGGVYRYDYVKAYGFSVRCVKD
jgi:uncharacterized protein (TIGR02145 family)